MSLSVCYTRAGLRLALGGLLALVASSPALAQQPSAQEQPPEPAVPLDPAAPQAKPANDSILDKALLAPPAQRTVLPRDKTLLAAEAPANQALLDKFQKLLTGAKLTGMFTVDGKPLDDLQSEQYEIQKVEKQTEGDWWLITTRIQYDGKDFQVPVPAEVKWAGSTPVITLDKVTLPGYGTFSARVVFHGDRYAGTWQHDDHGGHLFGKIELAK